MSVASALPLAATAYESGEAFGRLVPLLLGIALLVAGIVRRSRSAPAASPYEGWGQASAPAPVAATGQAGSVGTAAPVDPFAVPASGPAGLPPAYGAPPAGYGPPPAPAKRRGTGLIIAGSILLALGLIGLLANVGSRVAGSADRVERTVALPETVLGLPRDQALSDQARKDAEAASDLPPGSQVGAYTDQRDVLLLIAASTPVRDVEAEITAYRRGLEQGGGPLGEGMPVEPGPLGGSARCWAVDFQGNPGHSCIFVDGGSFVSTIDFGALDPQDAGGRGLQARNETVRPVS